MEHIQAMLTCADDAEATKIENASSGVKEWVEQSCK